MKNDEDLNELRLEPHDGEELPELSDEGLSPFDEETDLLAEPGPASSGPAFGTGLAGAGLVAEPAAAVESDDPGAGQWVWQYGAPPPPPSFLAVFFSGTAVNDLYRRFACALLVVIGCLLPWGPVELAGPEGGNLVGHATGITLPLGAISFVVGVWLLFSSCHGIYTTHQKILPVFLMIEPALVTWMMALDAWNAATGETLDRIADFAHLAGTGVLMTLVGSTWVAGGFLFLFIKVFTKKDAKDVEKAARRSRSAKDDSSGGEGGAASDDAAKAGRRGRKR